MPEDQPIAERDLSRLKWRCRRGLLENDLFVSRFFQRHESALTVRQGKALTQLMNLPDSELLELLLGRHEPSGELDTRDIWQVLGMLRAP